MSHNKRIYNTNKRRFIFEYIVRKHKIRDNIKLWDLITRSVRPGSITVSVYSGDLDMNIEIGSDYM